MQYPWAHERMAGDFAKAIDPPLGESPPHDFRHSWRARRALDRYDRGAKIRLRAQFVDAGSAHVQRGTLRLSQREGVPAWDAGMPGGTRRPVTVMPGGPAAARFRRRIGGRAGVAWRARIGETQEGTLVLPMDLAAAFTQHLTPRA